jgi:hypothetical protein
VNVNVNVIFIINTLYKNKVQECYNYLAALVKFENNNNNNNNK